jgi:CrcB protein
MLEWLLPVGVGGALGACTRYAVGQAVTAPGRGVLVANVAGSFLLGLLLGAGVGGTTELALGTGFCGALTTFSSFGVHTIEEGGAEYALGTLLMALLAALAGGALGALV